MIVHPDKANPRLPVNLTADTIASNGSTSHSVASVIVHGDKFNPAIQISGIAGNTQTVAESEESKKSVFSFFAKKPKNPSQLDLAASASKNSSIMQQPAAATDVPLQKADSNKQLSSSKTQLQQESQQPLNVPLFAASVGSVSQNNLAGSKKHVTFGGSSSENLQSKRTESYTIVSAGTFYLNRFYL
jgi:hypothetical protein